MSTEAKEKHHKCCEKLADCGELSDILHSHIVQILITLYDITVYKKLPITSGLNENKGKVSVAVRTGKNISFPKYVEIM